MIAVLDTRLAPAVVADHLQRLAQQTGGVVVDDVRGLDAVLADATAVPAATTSVLVATALLALMLGSLGVYAVLSFLVSRRTQEFGIRVALGALPRDVRWLVVREGATLCARRPRRRRRRGAGGDARAWRPSCTASAPSIR